MTIPSQSCSVNRHQNGYKAHHQFKYMDVGDMEVDYFLFHAEKQKVDQLLLLLIRNGIFLFRAYFRFQNGYFVQGADYQTSWDARTRQAQRVGDNVIGYRVTLRNCDEYPELVAAILIELGWLVKVRYRNVGGTWFYIETEFPARSIYAHSADWSVQHDL